MGQGRGVHRHRDTRRPMRQGTGLFLQVRLKREDNIWREDSLIHSSATVQVLGSAHTSSPSSPGTGGHPLRAFWDKPRKVDFILKVRK